MTIFCLRPFVNPGPDVNSDSTNSFCTWVDSSGLPESILTSQITSQGRFWSPPPSPRMYPLYLFNIGTFYKALEFIVSETVKSCIIAHARLHYM